MQSFIADGAAGFLLLIAFGSVGVALLRRSRLGLTRLESLAYGLPLGIVAMSLVVLGLAIAFERLSRSMVVGCAVASVAVAALVLGQRAVRVRAPAPGGRIRFPVPAAHRLGFAVPLAPPRGIAGNVSRGGSADLRRWVASIDREPLVLFVAVAVYLAHFWSHALRFDDGDLIASQLNVWGDWGMHLGDVTSFLWGNNLPPAHPRLDGAPMSYHYLSSLTAAAMATLGLHPVLAMTVQSFLLMLCIVLGLYAFGLRVIGRRFAALLFVPLFLLGGGWGTASLLNRVTWTAEDPLGFLDQRLFDRPLLSGLGYPLPNPEFMFQAQRGFLYGVPLALLACTLLLMAVRGVHAQADGLVAASNPEPGSSRRWWASLWTGRGPSPEMRRFVAAGLVLGILPIGHLSTVYALMLALPVVAVLSVAYWPLRSWARFGRSFVPLAAGWIVFGLIWAGLTVPQVLWVYGGDLDGADALRVQWGWLAGGTPWWFFWLKNAGTFAVLFPIAVCTRGILDGPARRFLLGFTAIFVLGNTYAFLPWDWNNALFFQYWLLSVALFVAALVGRAWERRRADPLAHVALTATVVSIVGLGLLSHLNHATAGERLVLVDAEGLALTERIRAETPADAVFVTGLQYSNPIAVLSGRRLVVGYTTWLDTQGLDYAQQEEDVRAIMRLERGTPRLLARYGVDYVAIGPWEREHLGADDRRFMERYPVVISSNRWVVFAVSPRAAAVVPETAPVPIDADTASARIVPVTPFQSSGGVPTIGWDDLPEGRRPDRDVVSGIAATLRGLDLVVSDIAATSARRFPPDESGVWSWSDTEERLAFLRADTRLDAVYTEDFFDRAWVIWQRRYNGAWLWSPAERGEPEEMRLLDDGRVGAVLRDPASGFGAFVVLAEQEGRWLIDEYLQVSPDGRERLG